MKKGEEVSENDENEDEEKEDENEDEEVKTPEKVKKLTKGQMKTLRQKQRKEDAVAKTDKAKLVSETRILTDADFRKIRAHNLKQQVGLPTLQGNRKRKTNDEEKLDDELEEKRTRFVLWILIPYINYDFFSDVKVVMDYLD